MTLKFDGRPLAREDEPPGAKAPKVETEATQTAEFESAETLGHESKPEGADGCPAGLHLHVIANRRFPFIPLLDLGPQLVSGSDPWNFSSHCPECGLPVAR